MDLVACEAPLDNSFQKDRRELVNKGSLGRRRKPSRSNLKLILSPTPNQEDIVAFNSQQHIETSNFYREKTNHLKDTIHGNHQEEVTVNQLCTKNLSNNRLQGFKCSNPDLTTASDNYREVVASLNQLRNAKNSDYNGNRKVISTSNNRQNNVSPISIPDVINSNQKQTYEPEKFIANRIHHTQVSVSRNYEAAASRNPQESNGYHSNKSNHYHSCANSKNQKISDYKSHILTVNVSNQQQTVKSRNQQNIITFSNHRQIVTPTPAQSKKQVVVNGKHQELNSPQALSKLSIDTSLPRTTNEPNLVAEAQQFSIEAKLRRKKAEAQGRSAVLIQTWERRTQFESGSKLRRDSKNPFLKNRFGGKEYADANSTAMPDSYICSRYKGSLQNGDNLKKGDLVPNVRDVIPDDTMIYRIADDRPRGTPVSRKTNGVVTINGRSSGQEPEWISLSRKLCAKFVEEHIEPLSPDSSQHEEPEGVGEEPYLLPQPKAHSVKTPLQEIESPKRQIIVSTPDDDGTPTTNQPPWVHLSRKLCNKFIEEHIEYPPITNGHFIEVPELVEPNGDVRIIEKVGKPKGRKSKQNKKCEPEWVSLSKKLRAKFIESHIDDPETISLDNQLNASDPEETSSESLSDVSQDFSVSNKIGSTQNAINSKNFTEKSHDKKDDSTLRENDSQNKHNDVVFPEKECCWEYQEMEFDQESNSGTFQEPEYYDEPLQEVRIPREYLPQDASRDFGTSSFQTECYNNDVKFAPRLSKDDPLSHQNKQITVHFIAHSDKDQEKEPGFNNFQYLKKESKHGSFFNLSTWEEAHCKHDDADGQTSFSNGNGSICKEFRSKSVDNLFDSLDDRLSIHVGSCYDKEDVINSNVPNKYNVEELSKNEEPERLSQKFQKENGITCGVLISKDVCNSEVMEESEIRKMSPSKFHRHEKKQNIISKVRNVESSSDDEVFDSVKDRKYSPESTHYGKISSRQSPVSEQKDESRKRLNNEMVKNDTAFKKNNSFKCNGMIPNSIYSGSPETETPGFINNKNEKTVQNGHKEPPKLGMSKWITISKSEQNMNKNEYSNLPSHVEKERVIETKSPGTLRGMKAIKLEKNNFEKRYRNEHKASTSSKESGSPKYVETKEENEYDSVYRRRDANSNDFNGSFKKFDLKNKCKSLCDISYHDDSFPDESSFRQHESVSDLASVQTKSYPKIEFQHFEFDSEIPLCAKLVSNQDRKKPKNRHSTSPSNRTESPCPSDSSHVYEDMFKESPSCPSDSEASSWTVLKNSSYYVNGRSSSMNDLDFSDSCSMSVKCDYASSSENSTLQSRHSSYASSSFYVNLRDYDSHMMEPSLNKTRKINGKVTSNDSPPNVSKSSPPTPESLRHLFTSPLSSIHSPPNRNSRLISRMPSDPQSHYYSTATATSSAFKHGFAVNPPKPKKTERSSSIKIKDIAHGIILTFKRFQNHSKSSNVSPTHYVDVSHLAEMNGNSNSDAGKSKKNHKDSRKQSRDKGYLTENGKTDTDSGFLSDVQRAKARRSSSDLTGMKSNSDIFNQDKKKSKSAKKNSNREKGKKTRSKVSEPKTVPTVSRKIQQMADGTLCLVTTVSGDTALPGVYSDSPDTSSELSGHRPVRLPGESNC